MAVFAAKAEDIFPKISDPKIWSNDSSQMRFVVVRSNASGCEPNCPEWISAEGTIEAGTPALLRRTLKALPRKLPIVVNSPGGNVDAALQLGRIIRKNKLDIAVGATRFSGCWPGMKDCRVNDGKGAAYFGIAFDGGTMCSSACPLMFAGGVRRLVGSWAFLGVHQITTTYRREQISYRTTYRIVNGRKKVIGTKVVGRTEAGSYKTYEMSKAVERRLSTYLTGMGIGADMLATMKATPASEIHQVALDDMLTMKLVTGTDAVDLLTSASLCMVDPLASNCRQVVMPATKAPVAEPAAAAALEPEVAKAPEDMRFVLVRGGDPVCNPDCPEWISAQGVITSETPKRLRQLFETIGSRRLPLVVSSLGGDVLGAMAVGRLIREHKLDVAVARTTFVGCAPQNVGCTPKNGVYAGIATDAGGQCDAACPILFAGGVGRVVGDGARLSVHFLAFEQKTSDYLGEMDIGSGFSLLMQSALSVHYVQLSADTMLNFRLTTGPQSVSALTGAMICKSSPKPDNCRALPSTNAQVDTPAKL
ncbi:hypothetical protein [Mesorhizobium sp. INR15]|uniref:hypothetical protein n=1 Tax=Mesorhizobium sp. INR15 TaxID=2654248 RepID=UPI0021560FAA|nr:hypothetical protein [Mesorhizobium sp. INR15]